MSSQFYEKLKRSHDVRGHIFTVITADDNPDEREELVSIYIFYNNTVCDISCPVLVMSRLSAKIKYLFVSC